jgi:multiple sugar transport system substrate-binding protein
MCHAAEPQQSDRRAFRSNHALDEEASVKLRTKLLALVALMGAAVAATGGIGTGPGAAAAGSCGTGAKVTIKWQNWISQEAASRAFSNDAVKSFEKKCPNITVSVVGVPAEKTAQALSLAVSTKHGADVFQTQTWWTAQYTALGLFSEPKSLGDIKTKQLPAAVVSGSYRGRWTDPVWGLAPLFLTYNKVVMKKAGLNPNKPPTTFDQLISMSGKIGAAGGGDYSGYCQDSGADYLNGFWSLSMLNTYGGGLSNAAGKPTANSAANVRALTKYKQWYNAPGAWAQGIDVRQCRDLFSTDKVAFNFESSWAPGIYRAESGLGTKFDSHWGAVPVPRGPHGPGVPPDANQGLALSAYSAHAPEAEAFIRFMLTNPKITTEYLKVVGFPTAYQPLWKTSRLYNAPLTKTTINAAKTARGFVHPKFQDLVTQLGQTLQSVAANDGDPRAELNKLQAKFVKEWK